MGNVYPVNNCYKLTDKLEEAIYDEAARRYRKWCYSGPRGQTVEKQDSFEYWIMVVTFEFVTQGIVR